MTNKNQFYQPWEEEYEGAGTRKSLINDYSKSELYKETERKILIGALIAVTAIMLGYAMAGDQEALKNNLIH